MISGLADGLRGGRAELREAPSQADGHDEPGARWRRCAQLRWQRQNPARWAIRKHLDPAGRR
jgi:hypothetical protein